MRDSCWGGAVCFLGCSLLIFQPVAPRLPSLSLPRRLLLSLPNMRHKHAQIHTDPLVHRGHSHMYTHTDTDADIYPSVGSLLILQTQQGRTWCVTDTLAAVDRLHYCLKQLSQQRRIHSTTLVACFVFLDIAVTISLSIMTG